MYYLYLYPLRWHQPIEIIIKKNLTEYSIIQGRRRGGGGGGGGKGEKRDGCLRTPLARRKGPLKLRGRVKITLRMQESGLQELDFSKFPGEIHPRILPRRSCFQCSHPTKQNPAYGPEYINTIANYMHHKLHVLRIVQVPLLRCCF